MVTILKPHRPTQGESRIKAGETPEEAKEGVEIEDEDPSPDDDTGTSSAPGEGPNPTA